MRLLQRTALAHLIETRSPLLRQTLRQLQLTSQQQFRTRPPLQNVPSISRSLHTQRRPTSTFSEAFRFRSSRGRGHRHNSSSSTSGASASEEGNLSFSQRMKKLSREYGWAALGVYLALTAIDLPFCFLAVRMLGTDRIGHWEHVVIETFKDLVKWPLPASAQDQIDTAGDIITEKVSEAVAVREGEGEGRRILEESSSHYSADEIEDHGFKEADKANRGADASMSHMLNPLALHVVNLWHSSSLTSFDFLSRYLDPARSRIRDPQIFHFRPSSLGRRHHPESSQNLAWLGLEHRQDAEPQGRHVRSGQQQQQVEWNRNNCGCQYQGLEGQA